jgi:hypothetical protein
VTAACGTTAPDESVTKPDIEPVKDWLKRTDGSTSIGSICEKKRNMATLLVGEMLSDLVFGVKSLDSDRSSRDGGVAENAGFAFMRN